MSNQFENGPGSNPAAEKKAQIENACSTAEEFCKNFFERIDNKRHTIEKLYLESATLSWNGNKIEGASTIQKFLLDKIPSKSVHRLLSMDAQPIASAFTGGQTTILVQVKYWLGFLTDSDKCSIIAFHCISNGIFLFINRWLALFNIKRSNRSPSNKTFF